MGQLKQIITELRNAKYAFNIGDTFKVIRSFECEEDTEMKTEDKIIQKGDVITVTDETDVQGSLIFFTSNNDGNTYFEVAKVLQQYIEPLKASPADVGNARSNKNNTQLQAACRRSSRRSKEAESELQSYLRSEEGRRNPASVPQILAQFRKLQDMLTAASK